MPNLFEVVFAAAMPSCSNVGFNWRCAFTGSCQSTSKSLFSAIYSIKPSLLKNHLIFGVLLGSTGLAVYALSSSFQRKKPKVKDAELAVKDDRKTEVSHEIAEEISEDSDQLLNLPALLQLIRNSLKVLNRLQMSQMVKDNKTRLDFGKDIGMQLDAVKLNCPHFNKTSLLYIEMFSNIIKDLQTDYTLAVSQGVEVETVYYRVCNIICRYLPKIDMSYSSESDSYPLELVSFERIEKAFEILRQNGASGVEHVEKEEAIQKLIKKLLEKKMSGKRKSR